MAKTRNITVTNSADSAITTTRRTRKVVVKENPNVAGWPTTDFNIRAPLLANDPMGVSVGGSHVFEPPTEAPGFMPNTTLGYIRAITGASTTVSIYEE